MIERVTQGFNDSVYADPRLWSCLSCGLCLEKCPEHVDFPRFIAEIRRLARMAGHCGTAAHGGLPLAMMRLTGGGMPGASHRSWLPRELLTSDDGEVAYFVGCLPYYDAMFSEEAPRLLDIARNVVGILNRAGIRPRMLEGERCCGHDLFWTGERESFLNLAGINSSLIRNSGVKKVVTHCPECCFTLRNLYPEFVDLGGVEILHWTEMILPALDSRELAASPVEKVVSYHDPCRLGRYLGVIEPPREILRHVPSLKFREMNRFGKQGPCCGTSAWCACDAFSKHRQISRLREAAETGAGTLVTSCPKCLIHFGCALKEDRGNGGGVPIQLQDLSGIFWNALTGKTGIVGERGA
jgi:Fe-S oxidoreductase